MAFRWSFRYVVPVVYILSSSALGYLQEYSPFFPNEKLKRITLRECVIAEATVYESEDNPVRYTFGVPGETQSQPRIRLSWKDDLWNMVVLDAQGRTVAGPQAVSDAYALMEANCFDLNNDGKPDFAVRTWYMGCGLAAGNCILILAVSAEKGYRITSIITMFPTCEDYVDLNNDQVYEVIHTSCRWSGEKDECDGRSHMYWVYHLLEIREGNLIISHVDRRFPKWIWYTFNPNHKSTQRLTVRQRENAWERGGGDKSIFWSPPEKPCTSQPSSQTTGK